MSCKKCNKGKRIVNKFYGLCLECNNERLHGSKYGKPSKPIKREFKPVKSSKKTRKSQKSLFVDIKGGDKIKLSFNNIKEEEVKVSMIEQDEIFYKKCFDSSDHKCEECGKDLPDTFRNEDGKVNARYRYSHIIPKSIAPQLRHKVENINHLCLLHHMKWENGEKETMKIFPENCKKFPEYF